jgi:hypothetical protein
MGVFWVCILSVYFERVFWLLYLLCACFLLRMGVFMCMFLYILYNIKDGFNERNKEN